jgi:hypothetical protein
MGLFSKSVHSLDTEWIPPNWIPNPKGRFRWKPDWQPPQFCTRYDVQKIFPPVGTHQKQGISLRTLPRTFTLCGSWSRVEA